MPDLHSTFSQLKQSQGSLLPISPSQTGQIPARREPQSPIATKVMSHRDPRSSRCSAWKAAVLTVAVIAVLGVVVWLHLAAAMLTSAATLIHLHQGIHTVHAQSESSSLMHEEEGLQKRNIVHVNVPVTLFDEAAALAMDFQKRREAAGKAEKEEAREKGVNVEWQRHHHLDGSVY
ncbi:TPA: hypothetical protein ACH3X3_009764 [Trebouxia sp. C0006]